jgi:hypothetical protein
MITRTAIKCGKEIFIGQFHWRHDTLYLENQNKIKQIDKPIIMGFVTDKNKFLNRKQAAAHAFKCKQVPKLADCLISEELW